MNFRWREILNEDYLCELKNQMRIKYKQEEESRKNSAESSLKHYDTWTSLWGRPGHGAPQLRGRCVRGDLVRLLHVPPAL
ncbi:hypothetical protein EVAR_23165_1 [Eumeta japonica]|uniref:Uncharacterized protein n=1 Tax=Eumeta variegata TaxID=151549 RepID=A0A4C1VB08_EUMVA|nr:hypothetical protein EVAR_23165_1 [Eumeta japonica]